MCLATVNEGWAGTFQTECCEVLKLYCRDCYHALTNFGAETHLGGGDTSAFIFLLAAITFVVITTLTKGPQDSNHTVVIAVVH